MKPADNPFPSFVAQGALSLSFEKRSTPPKRPSRAMERPSACAETTGLSFYRLLHVGLAEGPGDQDALNQAWERLENGHIESFHDKLRNECLNREIFDILHEARVILESWRVEYDEYRPHSALGY
jgi:integrase-like protein